MTDYEIDPPTKRYTTVHGRYQLSAEGDGFIETCMTKDDALRTALRIANARGYMISVFDTMARVGQGQVWEVHPGPNPDAACFVIPPARRRKP